MSDEQLTYEQYLEAVERAKTDKGLANALEKYERTNVNVQLKHGEYLDAIKEYQDAEAVIARYMNVREV